MASMNDFIRQQAGRRPAPVAAPALQTTIPRGNAGSGYGQTGARVPMPMNQYIRHLAGHELTVARMQLGAKFYE